MTADRLSWTKFIEEMRSAWIAHLRDPSQPDEYTYLMANAHRVAKVPVARLLREAPRGWNGEELIALIVAERLGHVTVEHNDDYVRALSYGATAQVRALLIGPEFFVLVWRMLELGADGLRRRDWDAAVRGWIADGSMDRERLLHTLLDGLTCGYGNAVAKWYADLYISLEPTAAEIAHDADRVRAMLRAPERGTVRLAVTLGERQHRAGTLDARSFLAALPDVASMTAANAKTVVRIAVDCAKADHAVIEAATAVLSTALGHPKRDIQSSALAWLEQHGSHDAVAQAAPLLSPAVAGARIAPEANPELPPIERVWRAFVPWPENEVVERTAVLLEDAGEPLEIEAGLQALAALGDRASLYPLAAQARAAGGRGDIGGLVAISVLAAAGENVVLESYDVLTDSEFPVLTLSRFEEVRQRLLRRRAAQGLVAMPETAAGWIGAMTLVDRLLAAKARGEKVWKSDLTAALLRLDPADPLRADAVAIAEKQARSSEAWAAVAYALGGKPGRVKTASWWVAAARARSDEPDALLAKARLTRSGQSTPPRARVEAVVTMRRTPWPADSTTLYRDLRVSLISPPEDSAPPDTKRGWHRRLDWEFDQPTVIPTRTEIPAFYMGRPAVSRWVGLTWPRSVEFAASVGVMQLAGSSGFDSENPTLAATLAAIAESPGVIGEIGRSCVAFGLSAKHRLIRAQAAELIAAELGARLSATELAATMAILVEACKLTRWAEALADAALISTASRTRVIELMAALLVRLDPGRSGMSAMLEAFEDELRRAGAYVEDELLRDWLGRFTGSSKASKAARSILGLSA